MQTFTIANQKGGVGKSTVAVHQAFYFASKGHKVLFCDCDGQGNSSKTLKERALEGFDTIALFHEGEGPDIPAVSGEITLLKGTSALHEIERLSNEVVVHPRRVLAKYNDQFDYCIIDTPPTLGLRLIASLITSDFVICPVDLGGYSTDGIVEMVQLINKVQSNPDLNPNLQFLGMVPNRVNSRLEKHKEAIKAMYKNFSNYIIKQPLVERGSVQEATDGGLPVWEIQKGSAQTAGREWKAAMALVEEISQRSN
jgi:chromosome partitioning protein